MKKEKKWQPRIIAATALAVFIALAGVACASAPSKQSTVTFKNATGVTIQLLYISETSNDSWGDDWLGGNMTLKNGGTYTTRLSPGEYDVKAEDPDGNTYTFRIEVTNGGEYSIDPGDKDDPEKSVTFSNATGVTIHYLYISKTSDDSWGQDRLGENMMLNGGTYTISLLPGEYDVKAVDPAGNTYTFKLTVTSDGGSVSIDPSDKD